MIQLEEVTVTSKQDDWGIITQGGSSYYYNYATGVRGGIIGEKGLKNADGILFELFLFKRLFSLNTTTAASIGKNAIQASRIDKGVDFVMGSKSKIKHIFGQSRHKLEPLVAQCGGQRNTIKAVLEALESAGKIPVTGLFNESISVLGHNVVVRGLVHEGFPKIGTMYIP